MAKYGHLKVFKDTYDLTKGALQSIRRFPKTFKYTLGAEMQGNLYAAMNSIIAANSSRNKWDALSQAILKMEMWQLQLRLAKDMQCFPNSGNAWFDLTERSCEILRQLEGWRKANFEKNRGSLTNQS